MANGPTPLGVVNRYIDMAVDVASSPALADYKGAASDLYEVSNLLLASSENMVTWLNKFRGFDFGSKKAGKKFTALVGRYQARKAGARFRSMKFPCGDIRTIYQERLGSQIDGLLPDNRKAAEARRIFDELSWIDGNMLEYIDRDVLGEIDRYIERVVPYVDGQDLDGAQQRRLEFRVKTAELGQKLERFADDLSDLVLQFAQLSGRPVTLSAAAAATSRAQG